MQARQKMWDEGYNSEIKRLNIFTRGSALIILLSWFVIIFPMIITFNFTGLVSSILLSLGFVFLALYYPMKLIRKRVQKYLVSLGAAVSRAYPLGHYKQKGVFE